LDQQWNHSWNLLWCPFWSSQGQWSFISTDNPQKIPSSNQLINVDDNQTINGYCNNLSLIQQVTAMQNKLIPQPSNVISNDYDLVNEIYQTIQWIPIMIKLYHINGHQDQDTPIKELPYPAQLNIAYDK